MFAHEAASRFPWVLGRTAYAAADGHLCAQWAFGWAPRFGLYAWDHTDPEQVRHRPVVGVLSCCVNDLYGVFMLLAVADLP